MRTSLLILLFSLPLFAEEPKSPVIPAELRAKYWRARSENTAAIAEQVRTQKAMTDFVDAMRQACGPENEVTIDQAPQSPTSGEPVCTQRPKPAEAKPDSK